MNRMTIRQKLYAVFGVLIGIFACVSIYSGYNMYQINNGATRIATEHMNSIMSLAQTKSNMYIYRQNQFAMASAPTVSGQVYAAQARRNLGNQMEIAFENLAAGLEGDKARDMAQMRQKWEAYCRYDEELEKLVAAGDSQKALLRISQTEKDYEDVIWDLGLIADAYKDFVQQEINQAADRYAKARAALIASTLLVVLLSLFMAVGLSRSINKAVYYLLDVSREVSQGNLTVQVEVQTQDEFGTLTGAYKDTVVRLHGLIKNIQDTAAQVASFAAQLTENASQSAQATQQVAISISKVAESAAEQGTSVSGSMVDIRAMAEELHGFEKKAESSSQAASQMDVMAQNGRSAVMEAVSQMGEIAESVARSGESIRMLYDRSNEIGQISETISNIAGQTNLLALNAAIEAARAGEAGRGFAVVAEEVRKLAEESDKAALQIANLISVIQKETQDAVDRMKKGNCIVEKGRSVINEAGESFSHIAASVTDLNTKAQEILQEARNSAVKAEHMAAVMENINQSSSQVAMETQSVSAATQQQSASMDEVAFASNQLSKLAVNLQGEAGKFKI